MGKKKQAIILGAGISGLALGYYLSKNKELEVVVLEKEERPGGWLHTDTSSGFHFETGPRTFKASRSAALLELIDELDMRGEVIYSAKESQKRYLWRDKKLRKAPDFFFVKGIIFLIVERVAGPKRAFRRIDLGLRRASLWKEDRPVLFRSLYNGDLCGRQQKFICQILFSGHEKMGRRVWLDHKRVFFSAEKKEGIRPFVLSGRHLPFGREAHRKKPAADLSRPRSEGDPV